VPSLDAILCTGSKSSEQLYSSRKGVYMKIEFTPEQKALRQEIRSYLDGIMTPELRDEVDATPGEGGGPLFWEALKQMGTDGWIGAGWPKELGGKGMSEIDQMIFVDEIMRSGFPFPFLTTETVGPIFAQNASPRLRDEIVPKILAGELIIAIGYSEPAAGTDLAGLKTTAKLDGDEWVINGQKMWTSLAQHASYVWVAARTDDNPELKKHKGISIIMVPTDAEGYDHTPVHTLGDVMTNATYYDNVRVPKDNLVGEINGGWKLATSQLNRERLSLVNSGPVSNLLNQVTEWAMSADLGAGGKVIDQPWVQINLAKVRVGLEALKLMSYKNAWKAENKDATQDAMLAAASDMADASAAKTYGTEFFVEAYRLLGEVIGQASNLHFESEDAVLRGKLEMMYRTASIITFGGGTNEIQRDIISAAGLWMPRAQR
jgi:alkylation response protein AidB-like acyl-CoA dehydrogenase